MSNRRYEGDPIDMTYTHLSEQEDGETVAGTTADDKGEVTTDNWPSEAPPREELTEGQVAVIEAAADPTREWESATSLGAEIMPEMGRSYAYNALNSHCPRLLDQIKDGDQTETRLTEREVREMRMRLLNGESTREVGEDYGASSGTVTAYANGLRSIDPDDPPALEYHDDFGWMLANGQDQTTLDAVEGDADTGDHWPSEAPPREELTEGQVAVIEAAADPACDWESARNLTREIVPDKEIDYASAVLKDCCPSLLGEVISESHGHEVLSASELTTLRQRLLNGELTTEVAEDHSFGASQVRHYALGRVESAPEADIPPLNNSGRAQATEYYIPEEQQVEDETQQSEADTATSDDADVGWLPDDETHRSGPTDENGAGKAVAAAVIAFIAGWLLGGGSE